MFDCCMAKFLDVTKQRLADDAQLPPKQATTDDVASELDSDDVPIMPATYSLVDAPDADASNVADSSDNQSHQTLMPDTTTVTWPHDAFSSVTPQAQSLENLMNLDTSEHGPIDLHRFIDELKERWNNANHMLIAVPLNTGNHYVTLIIQKFGNGKTQGYVMDSKGLHHGPSSYAFNQMRIEKVELLYAYLDRMLDLNPKTLIANNPNNPHDGRIQWIDATTQSYDFECGLNSPMDIALFEKFTEGGSKEIDKEAFTNECKKYSNDDKLPMLVSATQSLTNAEEVRRRVQEIRDQMPSEQKESDAKVDGLQKTLTALQSPGNDDSDEFFDGFDDNGEGGQDEGQDEFFDSDEDTMKEDTMKEGHDEGGQDGKQINDDDKSFDFLKMEKLAKTQAKQGRFASAEEKSNDDDNDDQDEQLDAEAASTTEQPTETKPTKKVVGTRPKKVVKEIKKKSSGKQIKMTDMSLK